MYKLLLLFFLPALLPRLSAQTTWYVHPAATGQNTGLSWTDAFTDLYAALLAADTGDAVWVAGGLYRPSAGADRSARFVLKSGVRLLGGFSGAETQETQRDWQNNTTVLDGDIGAPGDSTDNTYTLLYLKNPDNATAIDGFTFQYGNADQAGQSGHAPGVCGGAIFIDGQDGIAYPLIQNCIFQYNSALSGGGAVYIQGGGAGSVAPHFRNCRFEQNHALQSGGAVYKNGSSWQEVKDDFEDCIFVQNTTDGSGGAIFFTDANRSDTLQVTGCTFRQNFAKSLGGAIYTPGGRSTGSLLHISKCNFMENKAKIGGCFSFYSENFPLSWLKIDSCQFMNNHVFHPFPSAVAYSSIFMIDIGTFGPPEGSQMFLCNNVFEPDTTTDGIVEISILEGCAITIIHNVFAGLKSPIFVGSDDILFKDNLWEKCNFTPAFQTNPFSSLPRTLFVDNIFANNVLSSSFSASATTIYCGNLFLNNIFGRDFSPSPDPPSVQFRRKSVFYNNIFYNNRPAKTIPGYTWQIPFRNDTCYFYNNLFDFTSCDSLPSLYFCESGNLFNADPLFADTAAGDYRLLPCSPAIGAGRKEVYEQLGILTDMAGAARIQDGQPDLGPLESPGLEPLQAAALALPCADTATGSVHFFLANGCEPFQFQWQRGTENGSGTSGLQPGVYYFTVSDQQGKIWQDSIVVGVAPTPAVSDTIRAATCAVCADGAIGIGVTPLTVPWHYQWNTGDSSAYIGNLQPGTYTLTLTDAANGCAYIHPYTVNWSNRANEAPENGVQLVPNPATGVVWLRGEGLAPLDVLMFDAFGRLAKSWYRVAPSARLDLTGLPPGVYAFQVLERQMALGQGRLLVLR